MKYLILFSISLFLFYSCGSEQEENLVEEGDVLITNFVDTCDCATLSIDSLGTYFEEETAYTGVCIGYYPESNSKYVEKNLLEGLLHGNVTYFDKSGEVLIEEIYENGKPKRSGKAEVLECECSELNQKKASDPRYPVKFSLDDIPFTGKCKSYYPETEIIYMESNYLNGYLEGYTTFYNRDSSKMYMEYYRNGIIEKTVY